MTVHRRRTGAARFVLLLSCVFFVSSLATAQTTVYMLEFMRPEESAWQRRVIDLFHERQDQIRVEIVSVAGTNAIQKMRVMLVAGEPLDIGYYDPHVVNNWGSEGIARDLTPYVERDKAVFEEFFPPAMDLFNVRGRQYGIPIDLQAMATFYSQKAFDEAGLAYPHPDWTWDDFAALGRRLSVDRDGDGVIDRWAVRFPEWMHWMPMIWAFDADFVDRVKEPTAFTGDTLEMQRALEFMVDLIHGQKVMAPPGVITGRTADNIVRTEVIAMGLGNTIYMQHAIPAEQATGVPWNVTRLPIGPTGNRPSLLNAIGLLIFETSQVPTAAWEVIKFFSSRDAMELAVSMRGTMVPHRGVTVESWMNAYTSPKDRHFFIEAIAEGRGIPNLVDDGLSAVRTQIDRIAQGQVTIPEGLEAMRTGVENWLRQQPWVN